MHESPCGQKGRIIMITSKWSMGSENMQDAKLIRTEVFINEQHIPPQAEFDALDEQLLVVHH